MDASADNAASQGEIMNRGQANIIIVLLVAILAWQVAGGLLAAFPSVPSWRYQTVVGSTMEIEDALPSFEGEGWEIVGVTIDAAAPTPKSAVLLRRPKSLDAASQGNGAVAKFMLQHATK